MCQQLEKANEVGWRADQVFEVDVCHTLPNYSLYGVPNTLERPGFVFSEDDAFIKFKHFGFNLSQSLFVSVTSSIFILLNIALVLEDIFAIEGDEKLFAFLAKSCLQLHHVAGNSHRNHLTILKLLQRDATSKLDIFFVVEVFYAENATFAVVLDKYFNQLLLVSNINIGDGYL